MFLHEYLHEQKLECYHSTATTNSRNESSNTSLAVLPDDWWGSKLIATTTNNNNNGNVSLVQQEKILADIVMDHINCGKWKCYFSSSSNSQVGWILTMNKQLPRVKGWEAPHVYESMMDGFHLAVQMQSETNGAMKHGLLAPPRLYPKLPKADAQRLIRNPQIKRGIANKKHWVYNHNDNLVVQLIRGVSQPNMMIKCKNMPDAGEVQALVEPLSGCEQRNFWKNMKADVEVSLAILQKYPGFARDFQALVDVTGHITHIDFDRYFSQPYYQLSDRGREMDSNVNADCQRKLHKFMDFWENNYTSTIQT